MDKIKSVAQRLGIITVEDMERYTALELIMMIANKINDHSDKIQHLLDEGLLSEVEQIFDEWLQDGTFDKLVNQSALKELNKRIDETDAQLSTLNEKLSYVIVVNNSMTTDEINKVTNPIDKTNRYKVIFKTGIYDLTETLVIDMSVVEVDFQQSKLNANNVTDGVIVTVNSEFATPFISQKSLNGLYVEKNNKTGIGLVLQKCSDVKFENCRIKGFEKGVDISNDAYLNTFYKCSFSKSKWCIYMQGGLSNYGERITFIDCNIGESEWACYNGNGNGDIYFTNCSFDFNSSGFFTVAGGRTFVTDCHIEFQNGDLTDCLANVYGSGATLIIRGGWILGQGSGQNMSRVFKGNGYVKLEDVFLHNLRPTEQLAQDDLNIDIVNPRTYKLHSMTSFKTNDRNNLVGDSSFNKLLDIVQVTEDTGSITDSLTGSNLTLQTSDLGLKIMKKYGTGSTACFMIAIPINKSRITSSIRIQKPNVSGKGGTIYLQNGYCKVQLKSDGQYAIEKIRTFGTANVVIPASSEYDKVFTTNGQLSYTENGILDVPKNMTHYFYSLAMTSYDGANNDAILYIKDMFVEQF